MPVQKGRDFLLKVHNGSAYAVVGGMRTTAMALNSKPVDVSTKSTGAWRALAAGAGIRQLTLTAGGVFEDSASEELVRAAAFAATLLDCQLVFGGGDILTGSFLVASYERAGEHDGEETWSVTLESASTITFTGV
jgi:TP901-1 family phage major tail protein